MDIQIVEHKENNIQIIIKCKQVDNAVMRLKFHIELFDSKLSAKKDNKLYFINSSKLLKIKQANYEKALHQFTQDGQIVL